MNRRYKAFISYSWSDKEWGGWLHRTLETYRTPGPLVGKQTPLGAAPASLHPIFKDREEEAAGHGIGAAIEAAMAASDFLIVICSPRSAKSQWVNREVAWFKRHKDKTRILALVVEGEPGASFSPGRAAEECFPATLLYKVDDNLQPTDEREDVPLAADARKEGDGKRGAKLKLAAAMLGVGLDDLVRRDERRRTIRRRAVTTGALALSAAMTGLAFVALNQRDAAVKAEALAEAAQAEAEFQRDEAQDQVEWMLTDLRKRLDAVGRLDVLDAVGERLMESYDKQDIAALDPDALGRRARVQLLLGEVENTKGDLDAALARYTEAAATTEELLRRAPDDPQRIYDHSQSVFWVGYVAWQRGDADTARRYWTQYHDQARRLVESDPANDDWQAELMYAHSNLGTLQMDQGEAVSAETNFRAALKIAIEMYGESPTDPDSAIEVGQSYSWLAEALFHQAKIREAREAREAELAVYWGIPSRDESSILRNRESIALYSLADILISAGELEKAVIEAKKASVIADEIFANDPSNLEYADRSVIARTILGEALLHSGAFAKSEDILVGTVAIADRLVADDPTNLRWRGKTAALPELQLAILAERKGSFDVAAEKIEPLISRLRPLVDDNAPEIAVLRVYLAALACQARINDDFSVNWSTIKSFLGRGDQEHGPKTLTLSVEAHARLGQNEIASDLSKRLHISGFRHPEFQRLLEAYPFLNPYTE